MYRSFSDWFLKKKDLSQKYERGISRKKCQKLPEIARNHQKLAEISRITHTKAVKTLS